MVSLWDASPAKSAPSTAPTPEQYQWNVRCIFCQLFFVIVTAQVTLGALFDAFLYNLGGEHGNLLVGSVESTRGLVHLACAYPIGALADKISRVNLMKYSLPPWTIGVGLVVAGIILHSVPVIIAGMIFWAPGMQCFNNTSTVVIADSVVPEERTRVLSNVTTARHIFIAVGPLLQIMLLFFLQKDQWETELLKKVVCAGAVMWPGLVFWTLAMKDLPPLEKLPELEAEMASPRSPGSPQSPTGGMLAAASPTTGNVGAMSPKKKRNRKSLFSEEDMDRKVLGVKTRWIIALGLELLALLTALGTGMTVKFFPLFFRVDYGFTPIQVCFLTFGSPIVVSGMIQVCRVISEKLGRMQAILLYHWLAVFCLFILCLSKPVWMVVPTYLMRQGFFNARAPIMRAVIMDLVPNEQRGRWNSLQSIQTFTWSGSAALGGMLADWSGSYRFTFIVTACLHTCTGLLMSSLLLVYPKEKGSYTETPSGEERPQEPPLDQDQFTKVMPSMDPAPSGSRRPSAWCWCPWL